MPKLMTWDEIKLVLEQYRPLARIEPSLLWLALESAIQRHEGADGERLCVKCQIEVSGEKKD